MIDFQHLLTYLEQLPLLVKVVWILIGFLIIFIILLIFYLKYLRGYLRKKEAISKMLFTEYEANLINFLYSQTEEEINEEQQIIVDKMKTCITNKFKRKIFISVMSKLKNDISGEMADSINNLYIKTNLINHSIAKLKSNKWYVITAGIKELNLFEITNVFEQVKKHENHPKQEVRNEVQLYFVSLFHFKGLDFLNTLKSSISEWNQIQLLEILQKFDDQEISDITPWLKSGNESVVLFSLKLAKIYNQFQIIDTLLELLNHQSKIIRLKTIEVLNYFQVNEAKKILKNNFKNSSEDEQIAFFQMLENTVEIADEEFIVLNTKHVNFQVRVLALKILKRLNNEKLLDLKNNAANDEDKLIFNYLENN